MRSFFRSERLAHRTIATAPMANGTNGTLLFRSHYRYPSERQGLGRTRIQMVRTGLDGSFAGSLGRSCASSSK